MSSHLSRAQESRWQQFWSAQVRVESKGQVSVTSTKYSQSILGYYHLTSSSKANMFGVRGYVKMYFQARESTSAIRVGLKSIYSSIGYQTNLYPTSPMCPNLSYSSLMGIKHTSAPEYAN
jgi:hypothetical protein